MPYNVEEVRFSNGDVSLAGTFLTPPKKCPWPAIVFLHGSGPESRWGTSRFLADRFVRRGVAALIYDKRGVGNSTGDWKHASFGVLASDAVAALQFLKSQPGIDESRMGIYGHSQGGSIAPLVANQTKDVSFIISAAGYGGPAWQQDMVRVGNLLRRKGLAEANITEALAFFTLFLQVARTGQGWDRLEAALPAAQQEKWFAEVAPPVKDNWLWSFYQKIGDYDPLPFWEKATVPVLLVYGERDWLVNPVESAAKIEQALQKAGNQDYTILLLPRAEHNLTIQADPGQSFTWWHVAPGLPDLLTAWVRQRVDCWK